jgi:tryptophan-rich sensory protein
VQVGSLALRVAARIIAGKRKPDPREGDRRFYEKERLAFFSPPGAAFPIVWSINSVAAIAGGLHVLNLPPNSPGRKEFLRLQASAWGLFSTFSAAYFDLRSPINAALITLSYSTITFYQCWLRCEE